VGGYLITAAFPAYSENLSGLLKYNVVEIVLVTIIIILTLVTAKLAIVLRKQAKNEGDTSNGEEKYRRLIERTNDIIYTLTADGVFLFVSPAWTRLLGHDISQVKGHSFKEFVHADDLPICQSFVEKVLGSGQRQDGVQYRMRHLNGEWRWHTSSANPLLDGSGAVIGFDGIARDITANRNAETELIVSRNKLRAMLDNMPFLAWLKDADGRFEAVNEAFASSCGYTVDTIIGKTDFDVWPQESASKYHEDDIDVMRSGQRKEVEELIVDKKGRVWFETFKTPVRNESGQVIGTAGMSRDITERKRQAEELESFFMINLDLLCIADMDGHFIKTNEAWSGILGYATNDLNKRTFLEFVHPDDMQTTLDAMKNLGKGDEVLNFTNRYRCKDGTYRYIEWRSHPKGNLIYAAARDITDRKRIEDELRSSEANLRSIIDSSPVGFHIYTINENGKLIFSMFNDAADTILHVNHAPLINLEILDAFPALEGTGIPEMYAAVARGELGTQNFEAPYDYKGIKGVYEVRVFRGVAGQAVVNFVDISERKKAEDALSASKTLLEDKNKTLEQLIYVISHDLRSPLVNIDGFSRELDLTIRDIKDFLDRGASETDFITKLQQVIPDTLKALERIRASTRQMDALLKGLLMLNRMGRAALQIGTVDMNTLFQQLASSFAFRIKEAGITFTIEKVPSCKADATQVTQLFANLIDNAIKYRSKDHPGIISVTGEVNGKYVVYKVKDNGIGIAEKYKEKVFELFHRLNPKETDGDGLGLTVVKQILARLDGAITIDSVPGEGSVFSVQLPCTEITAATTIKETQ
ncbi:MAG: PAS domain S-box protein, partial [Fibrobacterota bacterium]|nr:PAS domain-containing sensor histidine kinase [Chitinispirillaceae bacterium]